MWIGSKTPRRGLTAIIAAATLAVGLGGFTVKAYAHHDEDEYWEGRGDAREAWGEHERHEAEEAREAWEHRNYAPYYGYAYQSPRVDYPAAPYGYSAPPTYYAAPRYYSEPSLSLTLGY